MNERTPDETPRPGSAVPDPHAGEPAPVPNEGRRPEADPSLPRPEEEEREGPVAGLFKTAGAEVRHHYTQDPAHTAEAQVMAAGVEEEGVESGQIFGLMLATGVAIVVLLLTLYFLFFSPALEETREAAADVPADRYVELRETRAAGQGLLGAYALNDDSTYRMPIDAAMRAVAQAYAARPAAGAPAAGAADPRDNGLTWLTLSPAPAVRAAGGPGAATDTLSATERGVLAAPQPVTPDAPAGEAPADETPAAPPAEAP
jgi:hypothetical protein